MSNKRASQRKTEVLLGFVFMFSQLNTGSLQNMQPEGNVHRKLSHTRELHLRGNAVWGSRVPPAPTERSAHISQLGNRSEAVEAWNVPRNTYPFQGIEGHVRGGECGVKRA